MQALRTFATLLWLIWFVLLGTLLFWLQWMWVVLMGLLPPAVLAIRRHRTRHGEKKL